MWQQDKKSFVLHAHTHTHLLTYVRYVNMCVFCTDVCTYVCMHVQQSGQKAKGENFLMVIDGDTSGVVRNVWGGRSEGGSVMEQRAGVKEAEQLTELCWPAKLLTSCLASNVDNPMEHLVGSVRFKCFMNLFQ